MPIYDYMCDACGLVEERLMTFGEQANPCSRCGHPVHKVFKKAPFVQFSGEGWYETEHGSQRHNCIGAGLDPDTSDAFMSEDDFGQED